MAPVGVAAVVSAAAVAVVAAVVLVTVEASEDEVVDVVPLEVHQEASLSGAVGRHR